MCCNNNYAVKIELLSGLPDAEQYLIVKHLVHCTQCREYFFNSLRVEATLKTTMNKIPFPPSLPDKILSRFSKLNDRT